MMSHPGLSTREFSTSLVRTVLVVEDEEMIRIVLTEFLQDTGYHVEEAANVAEARQILLQRPVDLVFSDVNMPGHETGFALEKWVRRHFPAVKVMLTSGFPQSAADTKGLLEPMIAKPYTYGSVLQRMQILLGMEHGHAERDVQRA